MNGEKTRTAFVVATKDRPRELGRLIQSLEAQTRFPDEVIIVDGGHESNEEFCRTIRAFPVRHIRSLPPSASRQRNRGIEAARREADFIGFLDDDIILDERAIEEMLRYWRGAEARVGGASFNLLNHPPVGWPLVKLSPFAEAAGLYSRRPGTVTPAGFQTMIGRPWSTVYTDWLPSTASLWRRDVFDRFRFDEWFEGYSYLEDLDFSYRVGKAYRLAVVADAGYFHFPAVTGRGNGYEFGRREVVNRLHFVLKNPELSPARCYLALAARLLMNLALTLRERNSHYLRRAYGNAVGLAVSFGRTGSSI